MGLQPFWGFCDLGVERNFPKFFTTRIFSILQEREEGVGCGVRHVTVPAAEQHRTVASPCGLRPHLPPRSHFGDSVGYLSIMGVLCRKRLMAGIRVIRAFWSSAYNFRWVRKVSLKFWREAGPRCATSWTDSAN